MWKGDLHSCVHAALLSVVETWKPPECLLMEDAAHVQWNDSAKSPKQTLPSDTAQTYLEGIMPSGTSQTGKDKSCTVTNLEMPSS